MSSPRDFVQRPAMLIEVVLRRVTSLVAGIGAVRLVTARVLVPGLLATERFVNAYEGSALRRARDLV